MTNNYKIEEGEYLSEDANFPYGVDYNQIGIEDENI